ncbi:MAG: MmcQ/YjbR family DNA-binding protein [Alistipes sp.]|nr:MmcQ/YjbR family DNA-binding protein [Alistipes sp.]MBP3473548.1 MmcQ/YjbR family DNA-binding protein [Alistipes sp.]
MDILDLREYVLSLPRAEETTPFDDATIVYKIAGKWFMVVDVEDLSHIVIHHPVERGIALRDEWREIVPAWHFNKRYWSSVRLDGDLPEAVVRELIRESYIFTIRHNVTPKARREELLRGAEIVAN